MLARVTKIIGLGVVLLVVASLLIGDPALVTAQPPTNDPSVIVPAELLPPTPVELMRATVELGPPSMGEPALSAAPEDLAGTSTEPIGNGSRPVVTGILAPAAPTATFDLCATTGAVTLPGLLTPVPIWGFVLNPGTCPSGTATLPGPEIRVTEGEPVTIHLTNDLGEPVSILVPGQIVAAGAGTATPGPSSFTAEVPPGGTGTYTIASAVVGTYLYESGSDPSRQLPMGLYGALIVESGTAGRAYSEATSAFDEEAVLVLSEIDPLLNSAISDGTLGTPGAPTLLDYHPTYWLINGKAYPDTATIPGSPGDRVLLRYLNAGLDHHTMALLGLHQRVIAIDAFELPNPVNMVAHIFPAGQTGDTIATIPAGAASGDRFPVFNRGVHKLTNGDLTSTLHAPGGMQTFLQVPTLVSLASNWNLVSLPVVSNGAAGKGIGTLTGGGVSPDEALAGIDYDRVYAYNGCDADDPWKVYDPDLPDAVNDLDAVNATMGLWVKMNSPDSLSVTGGGPTRTDISLCAGWNLVGYPSMAPRAVADILAPIADKVVRVFHYDASDPADNWKIYDPSVPAFVNDLTIFTSGRGYWVLVTEDTVLTIENN